MVPKLLYTTILGEVIDIDDIDDAPLPAPCIICGRPASPFIDTAHGPLCFTCGDGPGTPPGAAWRAAMLDRTFWRLVAMRMAQALPSAIAPSGR